MIHHVQRDTDVIIHREHVGHIWNRKPRICNVGGYENGRRPVENLILRGNQSGLPRDKTIPKGVSHSQTWDKDQSTVDRKATLKELGNLIKVVFRSDDDVGDLRVRELTDGWDVHNVEVKGVRRCGRSINDAFFGIGQPIQHSVIVGLVDMGFVKEEDRTRGPQSRVRKEGLDSGVNDRFIATWTKTFSGHSDPNPMSKSLPHVLPNLTDKDGSRNNDDNPPPDGVRDPEDHTSALASAGRGGEDERIRRVNRQ
jgi:hypothetical protein